MCSQKSTLLVLTKAEQSGSKCPIQNGDSEQTWGTAPGSLVLSPHLDFWFEEEEDWNQFTSCLVKLRYTYIKFVRCCYSGFFCDILSRNVKMYLWLKLYTAPFFVSGQTYKISKGWNNYCSHCIYPSRLKHNASFANASIMYSCQNSPHPQHLYQETNCCPLNKLHPQGLSCWIENEMATLLVDLCM